MENNMTTDRAWLESQRETRENLARIWAAKAAEEPLTRAKDFTGFKQFKFNELAKELSDEIEIRR